MILLFILVPPCLVIAAIVAGAKLLEQPHGSHTYAARTRRGRRSAAAALEATELLEAIKPDTPATPDAPGPADEWWWAHHAPHPPRVEILTGPGTGIGELARGTGQFPMLPPDPPPPAPHETGEIPVVNAVYGIPPDNGQYVDDLFAKNAPEGMIP
jgi:hypothetical protein